MILSRRLGHRLVPRSVWKPLVLSIGMGLALWGVERAIAPEGRLATLVVLVVLVVIAGAVYLGLLRLLARPARQPVVGRPSIDPDVVVTSAPGHASTAETAELDPDLAEDL